jgi:mono/diheme cytochrome c family protein
VTRIGRLAAAAAVVLGIAAVATWEREPDGELAAAATVDGEQLFHAKGCAGCHDGPRSSAFAGGLPSLAAASTWAGERRTGMSGAEYLAESMRTPPAFISPAFTGPVGATTSMPLLQLSEAEIDAIVDYLLHP